MKVLYVAPYRAKSNLGKAALGFILGLDKLGVDVVPRPLITDEIPNTELPMRLLELEQKSEEGCDVCIQHMKPEQMDYDGNFKLNVALPHINYITKTEISTLYEQFDKVITNTLHTCNGELFSWLLPQANKDDYNNLPQPLNIPGLKDKYVFYFIGKMRKRKNLQALIRAFHLEFHPDEPVELLIKTYIPSLSPQQTKFEVESLCQAVKSTIGTYPIEGYKKEFIISEFVTDRELLSVHRTGNCLVLPSRGDGWNTVVVDAFGVGNNAIIADCAGLDLVPVSVVETSLENASNGTIQDDEHFRGTELWSEVDIMSLRFALRDMYEQKPNGIDNLDMFTHQSQKLLDMINGN